LLRACNHDTIVRIRMVPHPLQNREESVGAITTITLPLPFRLGTVNCYLVETGTGFVLIDTGASNKRAELEKELAGAGCKPGKLDLIILTHGDFDHTGNAAYLCEKFGAKIAMHKDDSGMAEHGDMFWNRSSGSTLFRIIAPILFRFSKSNRFKPDIYVEEGYDFSNHGFDAEVLSIPGHSKGSIGILTAGGDLFCGDLLENSDKPAINSIMDDPATARVSIQALKGLKINTVYPGHGQPFPMDSFQANQQDGNQEKGWQSPSNL
jgi:hydroxyacylglutathione hydrolase